MFSSQSFVNSFQFLCEIYERCSDDFVLMGILLIFPVFVRGCLLSCKFSAYTALVETFLQKLSTFN